MNYVEFIDTVAERARASPDQAAVLARATLETLAERLTGGEARDLAAQLPKALQDPLLKRGETAEPFELQEFIRRVSERAAVDSARASHAVRAVLTTVRQAVTGGEFQDVMSQLPQEFREMVEPAGRFRR